MTMMASHCAALMSGVPRLSPIHLLHLAPNALADGRSEWRRGGRRRSPAPAPEDEDNGDQADAEYDEGSDPDDEIEAAPRRREEDPWPVLPDEVVPHLRRAVPGGQALADDPAHLVGRLGGRVRDREALADHAPELGGDLVHGLLVHGPRSRRGLSWHDGQSYQYQNEKRPRRHGVSASSLSRCLRAMSSVRAPTCLNLTRPCRSMKNVSGTP